jgi:hypothetical protein
MGMLLSLIPQELWILVLLGTAFGVIFGIVPRGAIVGVIVCMFLIAFIGPIISSVLDTMPWWISLILTIAFALSLIIWVLPKRTGSHLAALIIHDHLRPISIILVLIALILFVGSR